MAKVEVKSASKDGYKQDINTGKYHIAADAPKAVGGEETAPIPMNSCWQPLAPAHL